MPALHAFVIVDKPGLAEHDFDDLPEASYLGTLLPWSTPGFDAVSWG